MYAFLRKLQDPHLVAGFQSLCGVEHILETAESAVQNGDLHSTSKTKIGNGNGYNLRSRRVPPMPTIVKEQRRDSTSSESSTSSSSNSDFNDTNNELDTPPSEPTQAEHTHHHHHHHHNYKITNNFFYYLFSIGAGIGNEIFYCVFFPSWFWNVDGFVCRRLVIIWCLIMYFGQATKDIVRLPRPASPPVAKLEKRYELEYGMPSTHAMIGAAFPFSLLLLTMNRYTIPFQFCCVMSFVWCATVCLSRLYMGMHSVLDILAGLLYAAVLIPIVWPFLDTLDDFQQHHPHAPYVMVIIPLLMCIFYPTLDKWSTARGDTTLILGVGCGVAIGTWVNAQFDIYHNVAGAPPYFVKTPDHIWFAKMACRMVLGAVILFGTRFIMKALTYHLLCRLLKFDKKDHKSKQRLIIELPYKFITYFTIAFNVVYLAPAIFRYLDIEKEVIFTEV